MNHIWTAEMKWNEGNTGHEEVKISSIWLRKKMAGIISSSQS